MDSLLEMSHSFKQILLALEFTAGAVGDGYEIIVMYYGLGLILCS